MATTEAHWEQQPVCWWGWCNEDLLWATEQCLVYDGIMVRMT